MKHDVRGLARHAFAFALLSIATLGFAPTKARAYCWTRTTPATIQNQCPDTGAVYHLVRPCVAFQLSTHKQDEFFSDAAGNSFTPQTLRTTLNSAFSTWTNLLCNFEKHHIQVQIAEGTNDDAFAQYDQAGPNVSSIVFQDQWNELMYRRNAFAVTLAWVNADGVIRDADIEINYRAFSFHDCSAEPCTLSDQTDLLGVITHEAGHTFGLGHSNVREATMYSMASGADVGLRDLAIDDELGFCELYDAYPIEDQTCDYSWRDNTQHCSAALGRRPQQGVLIGFFALAGALAYARARRARQ